MRLADTCTIHTGYTARGRLEPLAAGGVLAIQLRDISPEGRIDPDRLTRVQLEDLADRYFVRAGDVLFRSRGDRNTASALDERLQEPALAVLPLMVLRPNRDVVTPEYLAWAINQPPAQRHFDAAARGTNIRMIPRSSLDNLDLDVPDIETQEKIVAVDALAERERALSQLAAETRKQMISLILVERANRTSPTIGMERTSK
ncbi:restriction endonuclease subunit S [Prosthecodimorpha staleyi]|uniref:Restriction endonuclease subunit S n=1 Tax=Prosthecodimorpha staleyi TaxID=2840188 RepID=A0A947GGA9_9HYPH|nr:restriction endonuclease subunit S [Prosthecodimorpha staleyi]MBT9291815.1 restriction endonuclease subunit S [Prosthecodimorpha staleyi]